MLTRTSLFILSLGPALTSAGILPSWLVRSDRGGIKCGVKGFADTDNNYFWSASRKLTSQAACSALCGRDVRCESFGFDDRVCMLFDEQLAGNFVADRESDLTFYDAECAGAATSSGATKPATSTAASTSGSRATTRTQTVRASTSVTRTKTSTGGRQTATAVMPTVTVVATSNSTAAESAPTAVTNDGSGLNSVALNTTTDAPAAATPSADSGSGIGSNNTDASSDNAGSSGATNGTASGIVGANNVTAITTITAITTTNSSTAVPDGCDIPASVTVTSFSWFNSSSNLDCAQPNFTNGSQVCYDAQQQECDRAAAAASADECTCRPFCAAGVPLAAYQLAVGFGPADAVSVTLGGDAVNATCRQSNPSESGAQTTLQAEEVGAGGVDCGNNSSNTTLDVLNFFGGDSSSSSSLSGGNGSASATGNIDFHRATLKCNGRTAIYGASFPLLCDRDADGNSNCTTTMPLTLDLTGFA